MMQTAEKLPDQMASVGSEWEVLATLLATPAAHYALDVLRDEHFTDPAAKLLFSLIVKVSVDGELPSVNAIVPLLRGQEVDGWKDWQILGMATQRIAETSLEALQSNIKSLKVFAGRRRMVELGTQLVHAGQVLFTSVLEETEQAITGLDNIAAELRNTRSTSHTIGELSGRVIDMLASGDITHLVDTGLSDLNKEIGGFARGELTILAGRPGMGKALRFDEPVLLADGSWRLICDLKMGDRVASVDGKPSRVAGVYPQGERQLYEVNFSDDRSVVADGDHLWRVMYRDWDSPRIMTTLEMAEKLTKQRYTGRIWIDQINGDFGEDRGIHLDPYLLGSLISNGGLTDGSPIVTSPYAEVLQGVATGMAGGRLKHRDGYSYTLAYSPDVNLVTEGLRRLGLMGLRSDQKFIPEQYLAASRQTRAALLRGLLDGDGWCEKFGAIRYATSSERLADGIRTLIRSLGGWVRISRKNPKYTYRGKKQSGLTSYVLNMSFPGGGAEFFSVESKRERTPTHDRSRRLTFKSIRAVGAGEAVCISVTHPSKLFITRDYIVTHNTTLALSMLRQAARKGVTSTFFSMEMPSTAVAARLLSDALFNSQMPVPYKDIIRGELPSWGLERIRGVQDTLADLMMLVDDQSGLTVSEIGVRARRYQDKLETQGRTLDVICVDHLGFIKSTSAYKGQRHLELGEITKGLKALAKSLDVAVVALCQLNRENEKRENRRPELSDLRNSGEIEEDADTVLAAYRLAYYLEKMRYEDDEKERKRLEDLERASKIVEIIGLKTRNGPTFSRKFFADMGSNYIRDMAA